MSIFSINQTNKPNYNAKNNNITQSFRLFSMNNNNLEKLNPRNMRETIDMNKISNSKENVELSDKTIIHALIYSTFGFGDYLRGTIFLHQFCKKYKMKLLLNVSNHGINNCLEKGSPQLIPSNTNKILWTGANDYTFERLMKRFINSSDNTINVTTNYIYNKDLITDDIKQNINSFFTFKSKYYDKANELLQQMNGNFTDKYNVLHIRCKDEYFNRDYYSDKLFAEIIKLQLTSNTIVISNNLSIKQKINKFFGFQYINTGAVHTTNTKYEHELEATIIDYILLSKSSYNYCFSFYSHGSGFSEQCSILNNIPYRLILLNSETIIEKSKKPTPENYKDIQLLKLYNENMSSFVPFQNTGKPLSNRCSLDTTNISFITLTNTGYLDYTMNCLESLKRINMTDKLEIYCIGKEGCDKLKTNGYSSHLIDSEQNTNFQTFRTGNWANITYYKFEIIYENLLKNEYVCFTDGDIVYENNSFFDYLLTNIGENDMLIQSEGIDTLDVCSGFMFIKSNESTLSLFDPKNVEKYKNTKGWDDQVYINEIRNKLKYKKLPLCLFPTGKYYYIYNANINPYMIHFNWIVGNEKKNKMIQYAKWYN
jgi:hypothetical protein